MDRIGNINVLKIKKFMKDYEFSQSLFCDYCGLSMPTLKKILNNDSNVSLGSIKKVAHFMNVKVWELLKLE